MWDIEEDHSFSEWYGCVDAKYSAWLKAMEGENDGDSTVTPHMVYVIDHRVGAVYHGACPSTGSASSDHHPTSATYPAVGSAGRQ
jgi:hypothetical protein